MIPLRLHLHNFLSYGEQSEPIDFDGIHVACLCGPNGHGKSAMLDAVTWALWGQARTSSADDLIRLGQKSMFVELEFDLDGQRYRVIRKRTAGKNSASDLQFQTREPDGQWRALTGQGVRGTQERIIQALKMDHETFINSAFLLQGRADEFARKTPGDRKRILGEILNLRVYDQLTDAARARRAEAVMRVTALEEQIKRMEREYARLDELKSEVERLTREHADAQLAAAEARAKLGEINTEKTRLEARRKERDDLVRRLSTAEEDLRVMRAQLAAVQARVGKAEALVARAAEIRARSGELAEANREREAMMSRLVEMQGLQDQRAVLERRLQDARRELEVELGLRRQNVRDLRGQEQQIAPLQAQVADLKKQVDVLDRLEEERAGLHKRLQDLSAEHADALAEGKRRAEELEIWDERFQLLKAARAVCPLCEGDLPDEKRTALGRKMREEQAGLKEAQGRAIQREADARKAMEETRQAQRVLDRKLETGQSMRNRLAQAEQKLLEAEARAKGLPDELELAQGVEAKLQGEEYAPEVRAQVAELDRRVEALAYDRERHLELNRRVQELSGADRDLHELEQAEAALPADRESARETEERIRAREESIADDRAARAEADRDLARLPSVEVEARKLATAQHEAEAVERRAAQALGAARQALEQCEALKPQIAERKAEREAAAKDQSAYEELAKAFGRNGIQALIIENALPEIEEEANTLLHRMSDGQLNVRLKTQRDLKSGGQGETLDIEISDGIGARRYELYSGGEAFRVNFALRIALSKLLAKRAGAPLETLFIDEGFGSQDQDGRQRLVEAIRTVQEDFGRILVITHIDELKDAFPVRIEVTKGVTGSRVAVY